MTNAFDDLLEGNRGFAESFDMAGAPGAAQAGVAVLTCMDARIDPLRMLGLRPGDAKVLRNPGGRVTEPMLGALVLAVNLLGCERVLVVPHTRCAMASSTEEQLRDRVGEATGRDAGWMTFGAVADQKAALEDDVRRVRNHPLVPETVAVGGFVYDVDTGRLEPLV